MFICCSCYYETVKWLGRCPKCDEWNSFEEKSNNKSKSSHNLINSKKISQLHYQDKDRLKSGIDEFDRVMGGGIIDGSLNLIGGHPGVGKSTLLLYIVNELAKNQKDANFLYISGEESEYQIAERATRLNICCENISILSEIYWDRILEEIEKIKPQFFIIDSIQTTIINENAVPGSTSQVKEMTFEIMNYVKKNKVSCFIVGHINKEGSLAGPKVLEHMVDTVLYFESDHCGHYRMLRPIKNRFGKTNELGLFEFKKDRLVQWDKNEKVKSDLMDDKGKILTCSLRGDRSLIVEVQALVNDSNEGVLKRISQGIDKNLLSILLAIIEKHFQLNMKFKDVFLNIANGFKLNSRDNDLAILASIVFSYHDMDLKKGYLFLGEVGLDGFIKPVNRFEERVSEAKKLGCKNIVTSLYNYNEYKNNDKQLKLYGYSEAYQIMELVA